MVIQSPQAVSTTTAARPDVALAQRAVSSPDPQSAPSQVAAPAQPEPQAQPSPEQVREAVSTTNEVVKAVQSRLQFVADDSSGQMVVRVMDSESNEVIRQIPSEEMLAISQAIERMQGLLVQGEA
ncbi:MAG: flagellar protein FlaG [Pseudomonadota bacterium]|jgi:flagellar protein FlaG